MDNEIYTCCICGNTFIGWGNNPWPVVDDEDARCCDDCNAMCVVPARITNMYKAKSEKRHFDEHSEVISNGKSKQRKTV